MTFALVAGTERLTIRTWFLTENPSEVVYGIASRLCVSAEGGYRELRKVDNRLGCVVVRGCFKCLQKAISEFGG